MTSKTSGEKDEEFNVDEKMNKGMDEKHGGTGFIGSLKRKMNKNVNDLKGMFNDMNEEDYGE